ncbi:MAG TPA: protein tyrosine phosphatase [Patescibacteria group bacterium]|nr:protein tyrosine phosphatase [Patescibacteria group bacterium]
MNVLFVCSKNKWRSRTAETIFKNSQIHSVKSAGTDPGARVKLTETMLNWADVIFVMEDKHRRIIQQKFPPKVFKNKIEVLEIPDEYQYMDEELVLTLEAVMQPYFQNFL